MNLIWAGARNIQIRIPLSASSSLLQHYCGSNSLQSFPSIYNDPQHCLVLSAIHSYPSIQPFPCLPRLFSPVDTVDALLMTSSVKLGELDPRFHTCAIPTLHLHHIPSNNFLVLLLTYNFLLYYYDAVGWVTARPSGLEKNHKPVIPKAPSMGEIRGIRPNLEWYLEEHDLHQCIEETFSHC